MQENSTKHYKHRYISQEKKKKKFLEDSCIPMLFMLSFAFLPSAYFLNFYKNTTNRSKAAPVAMHNCRAAT